MCIRDRVIINQVPSNGQLELNGVQVGAGDPISFSDIDNGNLTFQPDLDTNGLGLASLTFSVVDDGGTANGGMDQDQTPNSLVFDVTPLNDAPDAVDDNSLVTDEDVALTGNVLGNDSDIDGDTLTVDQMPVTGPSNGTLVLNANGSFVYTPDADFNGVDSFTYQINDGNGGTGTATVNITIAPISDAPTGTDRTITIDEDSEYTITPADFGFSDVDGDSLNQVIICLLYTSPSPRDATLSRMPSSA